MQRLFRVFSLGTLALLILPMLLAPFRKPAPRSFSWVRLEDTNFREITFENVEHDLNLAGMMFIPAGQGPFPGAVIIHGSGPSYRDNGWYLTLAHYLQDNGIVVLLPDKRGSESSGGQWQTASYEELATDTVSAMNYLQAQEKVPISYMGVIGLSEGGRIAPIVASRTPVVRFVVNAVGGAIPAHDALLYEETHNLRELGILPGFSDLFAYPGAWSLIHVRQKEFWDAVGNFDPIPYWRKTTARSLVLYGELDTNVPSKKSAQALRSIGNPRIEVKIYQGSGHALESPKGEGDSIFRIDALRDIRDFIRSVKLEP